MPFPPPFAQTPKTPRRVPVGFEDLNDTPTSESWSLPSTPFLAEPVIPSDQPVSDNAAGNVRAMSVCTQDGPGAPAMKDMDSFSQGTGQGSFEFSLKDGYDDFERPSSVAYNPAHPEISIENWRRDVSANLDGTTPVGPSRIPVQNTPALRPKRGHSSSGSDFSVGSAGGDACSDNMHWRKHKHNEGKRRRLVQNELPVIQEGFSNEMSQWEPSDCYWFRCDVPGNCRC
ncbi:hypothetical protein GLOTRDRAFT_101284 [Gloeophyllum trabeum ATCC 11539]|uniref:Uncharacterized protein n=1 Tax=Gloeophyllum trabeum (strain ATCC 11539 / FP-39264 / Madison 617) TaxID=670483 RepID=S7PXL2_GLOTA|nr:uncharacterized protein GLOTRDRAFT_101284 [Gloeophyllum trabeum ATCC 11539]EPQ52351.1 hypothetical protein GLOTRDRAFT_101284 [Gloeophyllum trabeum ATCC 11539]